MSEPTTVPSTDEIHKILAKRVDEQTHAGGISIGIIEPKGRRIVAHGKLANGDTRTLDGDTLFEIGSITKVFTSLLLADMVNRGEVALEDPAAKYLPRHVKMPERNGKAITLLDLATHTSGLPRLPTNLKVNDPTNPYAGYSIDDLYEFLSSYTLPRDPGSEFDYSNLGAGLLGNLLAYPGSTDYQSLIRSCITQPLGMPDTAITLSSNMKSRMATGHNALRAPIANWEFSSLAGAGALRSSANDMLTFLEAFLGYKESPLASTMKATLAVRRPVKDTKFEIGLGWFVFGDFVWHDGGTGGFRSYVACDLKTRTGIVAMANAFTVAGVDDIVLHLLNQKLPIPVRQLPEPQKQRTAIPIDPRLLDNYTGRYQLTPEMILEVTRDGDRFFAQALAQGIAAPKFELFAEGEKNFFSNKGHEVVFETDPEGRATKVTLHSRSGRPAMTGTRIT